MYFIDMVNRLDDHNRNRFIRTNFIQNPGERLLETLGEKPGATLVEKAAKLHPRAREVLVPILEKLDRSDDKEKLDLMDELSATIAELDREPTDGIEDDHYGEIRKFADSRYDGARMED